MAARPPEHGAHPAQKPFEPAWKQAEVSACGGKHGMGAIVLAAGEFIAAYPAAALQIAFPGFDGGSSPHLKANCLGDAADMAADPDPEPALGVAASSCRDECNGLRRR